MLKIRGLRQLIYNAYVKRLVRFTISGYHGKDTVRRHFIGFANTNCQHALVEITKRYFFTDIKWILKTNVSLGPIGPPTLRDP